MAQRRASSLVEDLKRALGKYRGLEDLCEDPRYQELLRILEESYRTFLDRWVGQEGDAEKVEEMRLEARALGRILGVLRKADYAQKTLARALEDESLKLERPRPLNPFREGGIHAVS